MSIMTQLGIIDSLQNVGVSHLFIYSICMEGGSPKMVGPIPRRRLDELLLFVGETFLWAAYIYIQLHLFTDIDIVSLLYILLLFTNNHYTTDVVISSQIDTTKSNLKTLQFFLRLAYSIYTIQQPAEGRRRRLYTYTIRITVIWKDWYATLLGELARVCLGSADNTSHINTNTHTSYTLLR